MRGGRRRPPSELRSVGSVVPRVLGELGMAETDAALRIAERWEAALGPEIARHCRPVRMLAGRVLEARVDSPVWCQQLLLQRPRLLEALRRELGDAAPADLRLRVG